MNDHADTARALLADLHSLARAAGLNLTTWAAAAGMKRQQLSEYVNNNVMPTLETFTRLADAVGYDLELMQKRKLVSGTSAELCLSVDFFARVGWNDNEGDIYIADVTDPENVTVDGEAPNYGAVSRCIELSKKRNP